VSAGWSSTTLDATGCDFSQDEHRLLGCAIKDRDLVLSKKPGHRAPAPCAQEFAEYLSKSSACWPF
jgi:hypothetical protein